MQETLTSVPPSPKPHFLRNWFAADASQHIANAVLSRELRVALRNERSFATLAIFVAILGAIVAAQFPADTAVAIQDGRNTGSAALGSELFRWFGWSQATLISLLLPSLATGALSQERERRTLEPLLLTPLSPLQIVWGKGAGVLAFACLLLLATVPLTSLCFLLGGVSPGDVIGLYVGLLGLAACITALGLGCSAKWHNTTQATLMCYALMPLALVGLVIFSAPGITIGGLGVLVRAGAGISRWWNDSRRRLAQGAFKPLWNLALWPTLFLLFWLTVWVTAAGWDFGIFYIVFGLPYFALVTRWVMQWAADEIARRPEPRRPTPERWNDLKDEWSQAVAPPAVVDLPTPTGKYSYTPQAPATSSTRSAPPTYGVKPFLPDGKNPIFQRDVRGNILGKSSVLVRYSYVVVILSELLALALFASGAATLREQAERFMAFAGAHLLLLITAGAIFGSRALAPEREQQTLPQLLTTPMTARQIIIGKFGAVAVWTFYAWVLAVPIAFLGALLEFISPLSLVMFLVMELIFGACAAAWGLFCSMRALTVRRALGWSLGGVAAVVVSNSIAQTFGMTWRGFLNWNQFSGRGGNAIELSPLSSMLPTASLRNAIAITEGLVPFSQIVWPLFSVALFGFLAIFFLWKTAHDFKQYLQEV